MRYAKYSFMIVAAVAVYELFSPWKIHEIHPCNLPSHTITINHGGQLGNNMAEYATLWYYKKRLQNTTAFIVPEMERALLPVFPNIMMPVYRISNSCEDRVFQISEV